MTVANTIWNQLGGQRFSVMTGCTGIDFDEKSLIVKLTKNVSGANRLQITLNADDTYTMRFFYLRGMNDKNISIHENVFYHQLSKIFERETELYTSLGMIGA